ncbi:MAG: hypothetical protein M1823_008227, partial [Watsoniomyces obsoletus]
SVDSAAGTAGVATWKIGGIFSQNIQLEAGYGGAIRTSDTLGDLSLGHFGRASRERAINSIIDQVVNTVWSRGKFELGGEVDTGDQARGARGGGQGVCSGIGTGQDAGV